MVAHGADHQCTFACAGSVHVQRGCLHLVGKHAHLRPVGFAFVFAVEDVGTEHVTYVVLVSAFLGSLYSLAAEFEVGYRCVMSGQVVLCLPVAVGAAALCNHEVAQVDVHLTCAARAYTDDRFYVVEVKQFVRINADGRNTHTVSHYGDTFAFVCAGEGEHTAHVIYLYRVLQEAFCHQFGAQRVACHDHCLGDFVVLCPDMRGRSVFLSHNI